MMTERKRRFAKHFVETGNQAEAARRAGYAPTYDGPNDYHAMQGHRLMRDDKVLEEIDRLAASGVAERITPEVIMARLWEISRNAKSETAQVAAASWLGKAKAMFTDVQRNQVEGMSTRECVDALKKSDDPVQQQLAAQFSALLGLDEGDEAH